MNKWVEKKLYHARRSLLPAMLALSARKILFALRSLRRGTIAVPVFRNSSANMTFVIHSRVERTKLYEIDSDPALFQRAYAEFEGSILPRRRDGHAPLICTEWIEGDPLSAQADAQHKALVLADLLAKIHAGCPPDTPPRFLHLERLHKRFDDNLRALSGEQRRLALAFRDDLDRTYDSIAGQLSVSCVHPDMIASNVIVRSGEPFVIDNEFFSAGIGKEFDIVNTMLSLPEAVRDSFLARYGATVDLRIFEKYRVFWEDVHRLKRLSRCMRYRHRSMLRRLLASIRER